MIGHYQAIQSIWSVKGKQRIISTYGKHEGVKLLGILNYGTGHVYCVEKERYDAEIFLGFIREVLELYPIGKIVMILDNARIHHAKLLESLLQENKDRLQFVFLPPYSPNPIEGLWAWVKSEVINNVFFSYVKQIREAVRDIKMTSIIID